MKCGILTFHRAVNYGGLLQAYALQTTLQELGIEAEIIDYHCKSIEDLYRPKNWFSKRVLKHTISAMLYNGTIKFNNKGFEKFRNQHLNLSAAVYENELQLEKHQNQYDFFITGSDQVFSPTCAGFDKAYFLNFVDKRNKKYSYAASFGIENIPPHMENEYKNLLSDFNALSVRESSGASIIQNLINSTSFVHIDPTFLLSKEQWSNIASESQRKFDEPYYLIYSIGESKSLIAKAISDGKKDNKKVIYITDRVRNVKGVLNFRNVNPEEWVYLIQNADRVYTNSFHGMSFCINLEKHFFAQYLCENTKANTRIESLLKQFDLHRFIDKASMSGYLYVEKHQREDVLKSEKEKAISYLKTISNMK